MEQDLAIPFQTGRALEPPPQSARLRLRELAPPDRDAIFDLLGDSYAMRFFPRAFSRDDAGQWIERNRQRYHIFGYGLWAATEIESGELLGDCGPCWHEINDELQLEVGYHFRPRFWGRGYATEAARAVIGWCFRNVAVGHVISLIRPENVPSRHVAERNGLDVSGSVHWRGFEHLIYRMERERWRPERKCA
jgi:RimJ/RimL family protein N-acetyltransferase